MKQSSEKASGDTKQPCSQKHQLCGRDKNYGASV